MCIRDRARRARPARPTTILLLLIIALIATTGQAAGAGNDPQEHLTRTPEHTNAATTTQTEQDTTPQINGEQEEGTQQQTGSTNAQQPTHHDPQPQTQRGDAPGQHATPHYRNATPHTTRQEAPRYDTSPGPTTE
eukprot:1596775-Prorocentrum_lima.AAC.1